VLFDKPVLVSGSRLDKWYQRLSAEPELAKLRTQLETTLKAFKGK